ncbi:MAG: GNAT family N-acetyltransferase [Defluviitaleaceae bacterium]|nr:GNAT family N-acetyltransferase [Defluviitaleaceae bacterium]
MIITKLLKSRRAVLEIDYGNLHLVRPCFELWRSFKNSYGEHKVHDIEDFTYYTVGTKRAFWRFLLLSDELAKGINLDIYDSVQTTLFWLTDGVHYLGSCSLRHNLNERLLTYGGHLGYSVRPSCWGNGLGTVQLQLLMDEARKIGLQTARLTCYETNKASRRVMEKNGAVKVDSVVNIVDGKNKPTLIYEIIL